MTYSDDEALKKEFSDITIGYISSADLGHRKELGQYFTPRSVIKKLLEKIPKGVRGLRIVDPACGTGEFLIGAESYFSEPVLYGMEIDERLVDLARKNIPMAHIEQADTLKIDQKGVYDVVVGNPPYFEFKPDRETKDRYAEVISGRPNIFSFFIKLGIEMLKPGGYLAYVLPPSMNNGAYFSKLRKYIIENAEIEHLEILDDEKLFHSAQQTTMLLVLRKGTNNGKYIFKKNGITIFAEDLEALEKMFSGKSSLRESGFSVSTGQVVWNQNKELLTEEKAEGEILIWSHNITEEGLVLNNKNKKQYVRKNNPDVGPAIVVNRIVGKVSGGTLRAALVPVGQRFFAENHVNVIKSRAGKEDMGRLEWLLGELKKGENLEVVKHVTGNTQLSKNELENLFPIEKRPLAEGA